MSVIERIDGSPGSTSRMPLDRDVEIEKDLPIVIFPHQALDPENRGEAHTARDWLHVVQARCGVNDHIPSSTSSPSILSRNLTSFADVGCCRPPTHQGVDEGTSSQEQPRSAMGGQLSFAGARSNDEVAPIAAVPWYPLELAGPIQGGPLSDPAGGSASGTISSAARVDGCFDDRTAQRRE